MVPAPLIWFLLGLGLLAAEWLGAEFDGLLAAALAALALSVLTALAPGLALVGQLLLFAAASAGVLLLLQRWSRRQARSIPASGASEQATVISGFTSNETSGRVRWQGQSWAATNLDPRRSMVPGEAVLVMGRDGNQLQVLSAE
ncbi:NfeD family protein [Vulcanococcus sp.]|jgi:membrane protein implicated in regulation of membrane protease activity|uniref:NfeD family protein n=1 Tax=Vulcanococcus sp. TaxID=2856995 RepID=UPI0037DA0575